jgi:predicted Ser/Thr protein kinase
MEPAQLGRYLIQSELGRGAMGVVYKATDSVLERTVAVKTVNITLEREYADKYEQRFYQEARAAGGLNHPNIVTIHDVGKAGDVVFMAMEYIEGVELRTLIGEGRALRVAQAVSIAAQVAEGLAYAHQRGVVHRDVKPANIMVVANGPVKITDFGIARMRGTGDLTQAGTLLGSPKYMSPEQVIGKRADHRSDIFSLGVILYEMLCGTAPFNGENVTALMYQIVNFVPPAPSSINPAVLQVLDHIVAKMLAKPLEERYQDATELAAGVRSSSAAEARRCRREKRGARSDVEPDSGRRPGAGGAAVLARPRTGPVVRLARGDPTPGDSHWRFGQAGRGSPDGHAGDPVHRPAARDQALAPARLAAGGHRRGRRSSGRRQYRPPAQTQLASAAARRHRAHRIAFAVPAHLAGLEGRHEGDFERVLLVPAPDRAIILDDPLQIAVLVVLGRDLDSLAGAGELARLPGVESDLLLSGLGAGDQRLGGLPRLRPRHLRQNDRHDDEPDQGKRRNNQQSDAHLFLPFL